MKAADLEKWSDASLDSVGEEHRRLDAFEKTSGQAAYTSDITLPGQLVGVIVRSATPYGKVVDIDTSAALELDGVVAVITADDVADVVWYSDDEPILPGVVRFVGDDVAVVIADDIESARRGAAIVEVEYEAFDHVTDPERIGGGSEPELLGNAEIEVDEDGRGDVDTAIEDAAVLVEGTFRSPVAIHNSMEPHGAVAEWRGDSVTVYTSTQGVNDVREKLAERLGLNHNQVRVVCEYMGGGFGAKQVPWKPTMFAVLAARMLGRPVRVMNDRRAENLAAGKRSSSVQTVRIGADNSGALVAIDAQLDADLGAYAVGGEASMLAGPFLNMYRCENVRVLSRTVRTNTGPAVAFRAPGYVEATFVLESLMDELAGKLGIDPIELRRRNHAGKDQQDDIEWSHPEGILRSYEQIAEATRWEEQGNQGEQSANRSEAAPGVKHGRGFAAHDWVAASASPPGHATIAFNFDGSIHVGTSAQDIGTGTRTVLSQVVADELGVDVGSIRLSLGDTSAGPPAPTSAGSATVPTMAPAVRAAAAAAADDLLTAAAEHLDVEKNSLSFDGEYVRCEDSAVDDQPLGDLLADLSPRVVHGWGGREETAEKVSPRAQGSAVADVVVDTLTGEVRVTSVTVAPDCGRILNPLLAESQVIGGVTQGIGFALTERQIIDHDLGVVCNADFNEYLVPTMADTCEIRHVELDIPDLRANSVGAKGIGELPLIPVPAAIANAVHDAVGVRFTELPITRKRVLEALAEQSRTGADR